MTGRFIALCALLLGWSATAGADNTADTADMLDTASAIMTRPDCVKLTRQAGGEELINGCGACRLVSVERSRPGAGVPTIRIISVPEKTRQALPFRGPGNTRITSERSCPGSEDEWGGDPAARSPGCVQFGQTHAGDAVLVNPCAVCRAAIIERIDITGNLSRRSYAVSPRSSVGISTDGLARARIIRDDPCG